MDRWLVELEAVLTSERELTQDELGDIVEGVVDRLDETGEDPSVSTTRTGPQTIGFTVSVVVAAPDEWRAFDTAGALLRDAFDSAAVDAEHLVPAGLRLLAPA